MKKLRLKKWVKYTIVITSIIIVGIILIHLICTNLKEINKISRKCDEKLGHTCSSYELRNFLIGDHNE